MSNRNPYRLACRALVLALASVVVVQPIWATNNSEPLPETFNVPNKVSQQSNSPAPSSYKGARAMDALISNQASDAEKAALDEVQDVLGLGYNSLRGKTAGNCVKGMVNGIRPSSFNTTYAMKQIDSSSQLKQEMSAEASASGGFAAWSAKASVSMDRSSSNDVNTKFVLLKIKSVATPNIVLHDARIAVDMPKDSDADKDKFYAVCGDQYVDSVVMGGELTALLTYKKTSDQDESALLTSLSVSGPSVSADASFSKKMAELQTNMQITINYIKVGGIDAVPDSTVAGLLKFAANFGKSMTGLNAAYIGFNTKSYDALNLILPDLSAQRQTVSDLRDSIAAREKTLNTISSILAVYKKLPIVPSNTLDDRYREIYKEIGYTNIAIEHCIKDPLKDCNPDQSLLKFDPPALHRPQIIPMAVSDRSYSIKKDINEAGWKLALIGHVCFDDSLNLCFGSGIVPPNDTRHFIDVRVNNNSSRYAGPIDLPYNNRTSVVTLRVVDDWDGYGDNSGDLAAVFY